MNLTIENKYVVVNKLENESIVGLQTIVDVSYNDELKKGFRTIIRKDLYDKIFTSGIKSRVRAELKSSHILEPFNFHNWVSYTYNYFEKTNINFNHFLHINHNLKAIREYQVTNHSLRQKDKILKAAIDKYLNKDIIIPFSLNDRKKKFSYAFKNLQRHIEKYI